MTTTDKEHPGTKSWFENRSFWTAIEPAAFAPERLEATSIDVERIVKTLALRSGARILDLCCGFGRHAIALANKGFEICAVDLNEDYLKRGLLAAKEYGVSVEFLRSDMRVFQKPETFDAILNLYTSFGYFENIEDDKRVLKNVFSSLKPGGKYLVDIFSIHHIASNAIEVFENQDTLSIKQRQIDNARSSNAFAWVIGKWYIANAQQRREYSFSQRIYTASGLASQLLNTGFSRVDIYQDYEANPFHSKSSTLVVVAIK